MNHATADCPECRELIGGYVLDALEPEEMALVRRHLETCAHCAREHAELASIPALLDYADSADAVPERPPARLEDAVLDRFAREHRGAAAAGRAEQGHAGVTADGNGERRGRNADRPTLRERWDALRARPGFGLAFAGAAAIFGAVVLAIGVIASTGGDDGGGGTAPLAQQRPPDFTSELAAVSTSSGASGDARLFQEQTGTVVHLNIKGLKPGPAGPYSYEMWCVGKNGWRVSAGSFRVDREGNATVRLTAAADPAKYDTLSIEATDPSAGGANGEPVMVGKIHS